MKNLNIGQPVIPPALHLMNQPQPRQEPLNHPSKKNVEVFCQFKKPTYDLLFDWEELDIIEPAEISFEDPQSSCSSGRYYDHSMNMLHNAWKEHNIITIDEEEDF